MRPRTRVILKDEFSDMNPEVFAKAKTGMEAYIKKYLADNPDITDLVVHIEPSGEISMYPSVSELMSKIGPTRHRSDSSTSAGTRTQFKKSAYSEKDEKIRTRAFEIIMELLARSNVFAESTNVNGWGEGSEKIEDVSFQVYGNRFSAAQLGEYIRRKLIQEFGLESTAQIPGYGGTKSQEHLRQNILKRKQNRYKGFPENLNTEEKFAEHFKSKPMFEETRGKWITDKSKLVIPPAISKEQMERAERLERLEKLRNESSDDIETYKD
jgi:hypothetical protein